MIPKQDEKGVFVVVRIFKDDTDGAAIREIQKRVRFVAQSEHIARINADDNSIIMGPVLFFDEEG